MNELFSIAAEKLGLKSVAYAFKGDGQPISDTLILQPRDVVFVSKDKFFTHPKTNDSKFGGDDWVTLNVGGRVFSTTKSTLTKDPHNMLARLVSDDWDATRDSLGCYLIDRSPEHFAPILHYLRTGTLVLDANVNALGVMEEAKFYGVSGVEELLQPRHIQSDGCGDPLDNFTRRDIVGLLLTSSNLQLRSQGIDLVGVDLSRLDLQGINFRMSNFREANLEAANLDNARLQQANLKDANMMRASLRGVNLVGANLEGANMKGANFEDREMLQKANLEGTNLKNADLEDANLAGANLRAANLRGANLSGANLRGADLAGANLEDTNLRGANVTNANMRGANFVGADFDIRYTAQ
jgi:uncharacterized protein YjbI with pentapeptide repeats